MTNRIMWRIDDGDTLVIFPENGITGTSQGSNQEGQFDIYNAETNKREDLPFIIKKVRTEGKLVFQGSLAEMFSHSSAKEIDLSSFDTRNVTDMSDMFTNSQAHSINVSSFETSNVTNMSGMFAFSKVQNLDVSGFDTRNVTSMYYMFAFVQAKELNLTSFTISDKTNTNYMFRNTPNTIVLVNEEMAEFIQGVN